MYKLEVVLLDGTTNEFLCDDFNSACEKALKLLYIKTYRISPVKDPGVSVPYIGRTLHGIKANS